MPFGNSPKKSTFKNIVALVRVQLTPRRPAGCNCRFRFKKTIFVEHLCACFLPEMFQELFLGGHFRPRKNIFSPPPLRNSPIRRRHPAGPSAPPPPRDPTPEIFNYKLEPPPPPGASDSPFPPPRSKTSTKFLKSI